MVRPPRPIRVLGEFPRLEIFFIFFDPVSCVVTRGFFIHANVKTKRQPFSFVFLSGGIVLADEERSNGASSGIGEGCVWICRSVIAISCCWLPHSCENNNQRDETRMVLQKFRRDE